MRSGYIRQSVWVPENRSEKLDLGNSSGRKEERIIRKGCFIGEMKQPFSIFSSADHWQHALKQEADHPRWQRTIPVSTTVCALGAKPRKANITAGACWDFGPGLQIFFGHVIKIGTPNTPAFLYLRPDKKSQQRGVTEWLNVPVSKTGDPSRDPGVRIPPPLQPSTQDARPPGIFVL